MTNFLIGWLIAALVVAVFIGFFVKAGKRNMSAPRMKKIRKSGF